MKVDPKKIILAAYEFRHQLTSESDRACALMAGAYLDSQLSLLLRASLVDDRKVLGELLDTAKPLGTFSPRIDTVYLLGLIPANYRRDLHLIRKIRNEFGHVAEPISFETQKISQWCKSLTITYADSTMRPRAYFTSAAMGILSEIDTSIIRSTNIPKPLERKLDQKTISKAREEILSLFPTREMTKEELKLLVDKMRQENKKKYETLGNEFHELLRMREKIKETKNNMEDQ